MATPYPRPAKVPPATRLWKVLRNTPDNRYPGRAEETLIWYDRMSSGGPDLRIPRLCTDEELDSLRLAYVEGIRPTSVEANALMLAPGAAAKRLIYYRTEWEHAESERARIAAQVLR